MLDRLRSGVAALRRRARRVERRELREFRAWAETTSSVVHLSALVFVPLLVAVVTYLSNTLAGFTYLLFPPLASGTYTMFADPEGKYATSARFVGGLTIGACCGWVALEAAAAVGVQSGTGAFQVSVLGAGLAVFLAGAVTWLLAVEEPAAYATALIGLLVPDQQLAFVVSVFLASLLVASVFVLWRDQFYERRARFLYQSIRGDDHVLVPMRGEDAGATAMLGARLAGAHDAGKVVLLDVVDDAAVARAERERLRGREDVELARSSLDGGSLPSTADEAATLDPETAGSAGAGGDAADADPVSSAVAALEHRAGEIEAATDVPCEVLVAVQGDGLAGAVVQAARATNCDLVAAPYEGQDGGLAPWIRTLFRADVDVLVHRSVDGRTRWRRLLVPVRRTSDVAHSMVDFARRLVGGDGSIGVCTCIGADGDRRRAEEMLADLVGPFEGPIETRVSRSSIQPFLTTHATHYDLVFLGASRDRSTASRLVSPPTFERIRDLDTDVAIVDRGG